MYSFATKMQQFALANGLATLLSNVSRLEGQATSLRHFDTASLKQLQKSSIITSSVASCAIEGINVSEIRLEELDEEPALPNRRDEREVLNYKKALDFLYSADPKSLQPSPALLRKLHGIAMDGSATAGQYKQRDNLIIEKTPFGDKVRFTPASAAATPDAVESLFAGFNEVLNKGLAPIHVAVAALTLDITCIHPFADGNGRTSRLLTTAALLESGVEMPKYVSLEEIVRERDEFYYQALYRSSKDWHTGEHDPAPFIRFHLEMLQTGFQILEQRILDVKLPIRVLFDQGISDEVKALAFESFQEVYPQASWASAELRSKGRKVFIEGYDFTLPSRELDRFAHANKLAEKSLSHAERRLAKS